MSAHHDIAIAYLSAGAHASSRCAAAALCGHGHYLGQPNLLAAEAHVAQAQALRAVIREIQESAT